MFQALSNLQSVNAIPPSALSGIIAYNRLLYLSNHCFYTSYHSLINYFFLPHKTLYHSQHDCNTCWFPFQLNSAQLHASLTQPTWSKLQKSSAAKLPHSTLLLLPQHWSYMDNFFCTEEVLNIMYAHTYFVSRICSSILVFPLYFIAYPTLRISYAAHNKIRYFGASFIHP